MTTHRHLETPSIRRRGSTIRASPGETTGRNSLSPEISLSRTRIGPERTSNPNCPSKPGFLRRPRPTWKLKKSKHLLEARKSIDLLGWRTFHEYIINIEFI